MATIAVLGTLDSKGEEHAYVAEKIRARGHRPLLIDVGSGGPPTVTPDFTREQVASSAGLDLAALSARRDRGECVVAMSKAAPVFLAKLAAVNDIDGVISLGGGGGTAIATAAMRALPLGRSRTEPSLTTHFFPRGRGDLRNGRGKNRGRGRPPVSRRKYVREHHRVRD